MSKTHIETLIPDIYKMLDGRSVEVPEELAERFAQRVKEEVVRSLRNDRKPALSMSNFSTPDRKLYYQLNHPEEAEELKPNTRITFMLGHMAEALVLLLTELAVHEVTGEQDTMKIHELEGHRDAVIDGNTVDVKSANSRSFRKFRDGTLEEDDPFGYIDQLSLYVSAGVDDPLVRNKTSGYFLAIDKELGHLALLEVKVREKDYSQEWKRKMLMLNGELPPRCYGDVEEGKSGNRKLGVQCSYCAFKQTCWPNLRTFLYSNGPKFLTKVEREPDVKEFKRTT